MPGSDAILVLTSCTKSKKEGLRGRALPAERLYAGDQHRRLMRGVDAFRACARDCTLDLRIVSAGYGLIHGVEEVETYDSTFAGMPRRDLDQRARDMRLPEEVQGLLAVPRKLNIVLLGGDYLRAAGFPDQVTTHTPTLVLCGQEWSRRLRDIDSLITVPAGVEQTRQVGCGLVGLKGEMVARLLMELGRDTSLTNGIVQGEIDVLDLISRYSAWRALQAA